MDTYIVAVVIRRLLAFLVRFYVFNCFGTRGSRRRGQLHQAVEGRPRSRRLCHRTAGRAREGRGSSGRRLRATSGVTEPRFPPPGPPSGPPRVLPRLGELRKNSHEERGSV